MSLLEHRNTPSTGINLSPAQRLLNRRTRTLLPTAASLLEPKTVDSENTKANLQASKKEQAKYYNKGARDLDPLEEGDLVQE